MVDRDNPRHDPELSEPLDVRLAREIPEVDTGELLVTRHLTEPGADSGLDHDDPDPGDVDQEQAPRL